MTSQTCPSSLTPLSLGSFAVRSTSQVPVATVPADSVEMTNDVLPRRELFRKKLSKLPFRAFADSPLIPSPGDTSPTTKLRPFAEESPGDSAETIDGAHEVPAAIVLPHVIPTLVENQSSSIETAERDFEFQDSPVLQVCMSSSKARKRSLLIEMHVRIVKDPKNFLQNTLQLMKKDGERTMIPLFGARPYLVTLSTQDGDALPSFAKHSVSLVCQSGTQWTVAHPSEEAQKLFF